MHVVALLDRSSAQLAAAINLVRQLVRHSLFRTRSRVRNNPTQRQAGAPVLWYFDRHLVVGATHATRLYLQHGLGVLHRLLENLEGVVLGPLLHLLHGLIEDP